MKLKTFDYFKMLNFNMLGDSSTTYFYVKMKFCTIVSTFAIAGSIRIKFTKCFGQHGVITPRGPNIFKLFSLQHVPMNNGSQVCPQFLISFCFLRYFKCHVLKSFEYGTKKRKTVLKNKKTWKTSRKIKKELPKKTSSELVQSCNITWKFVQ